MFSIPHLIGIERVILHMLSVPQLLEKGGGIPYLGSQIMKVLGYKRMRMKEFLDDIFKSKIFLRTFLEVKEPIMSRGG